MSSMWHEMRSGDVYLTADELTAMKRFTQAEMDSAIAYEREQWEYTVRAILLAKWCTPEWENAWRGAIELLNRP